MGKQTPERGDRTPTPAPGMWLYGAGRCFPQQNRNTAPSWSGTCALKTAERSRSADMGERPRPAPARPPCRCPRCGCWRRLRLEPVCAGAAAGLFLPRPACARAPRPPPCCSCMEHTASPSSSTLCGWGSHRPHLASACRVKVTAATSGGGALSPALQVTPGGVFSQPGQQDEEAGPEPSTPEHRRQGEEKRWPGRGDGRGP